MVYSGAARSTVSLKQWREIELRVTREEWKQLKEREIETESKFKFRRAEIITAEFVELLPIRATKSFITLKKNVIDDDFPLLHGIEAIEN